MATIQYVPYIQFQNEDIVDKISGEHLNNNLAFK